MGGYIALEIVRQAADRVAKLALLDTGARADTPEATAKRRTNIALAESGRFAEVIDPQFPLYVHPSRADDAALKADLSRDVPRRRAAGLRAPAEGDHDARRTRGRCCRRSAARRWCWSARGCADAAGAVRRNGGRHSRRAAGQGAGCGHLSTMERPEAVNGARRLDEPVSRMRVASPEVLR